MLEGTTLLLSMVTNSLPPSPGVCMHQGHRNLQDKRERKKKPPHTFDPVLLEFLVPRSHSDARVLEWLAIAFSELGIAYSITDGIPNMIPQAARMTHQNKKKEEMEH
uniref:Uncharacterized protein n=1 Tax=Moschus moschiferus TaxID=68415 RepID=A0A8C6CNP1_MOSMO